MLNFVFFQVIQQEHELIWIFQFKIIIVFKIEIGSKETCYQTTRKGHRSKCQHVTVELSVPDHGDSP